MITCTADTTGFNRALAALADGLGISGTDKMGAFIRRQGSLLARTLVDFTPPKDRGATATRIDKDVRSKFLSTGYGEHASMLEAQGGKAGRGDVRWYAWSNKALYGITDKDLDLRRASLKDLIRTYWHITPKGHIRTGQHGKQTVLLRRQVLIKKGQLTKIVSTLKQHIGRLRSGWVVGWQLLGAQGRSLPQWVSKHRDKQRGYVRDQSKVLLHPTVTVGNTAYGATPELAEFLTRTALETRAKAMLADLQLYIRGIKDKAKLKL
jgi:hypothetical protein